MKTVWGLGIALLIALIAYFAGYLWIGAIPFFFILIASFVSARGVSGASIITFLSLGGRVNIITFLGILIAIAVLLGMLWRDYGV